MIALDKSKKADVFYNRVEIGEMCIFYHHRREDYEFLFLYDEHNDIVAAIPIKEYIINLV